MSSPVPLLACTQLCNRSCSNKHTLTDISITLTGGRGDLRSNISAASGHAVVCESPRRDLSHIASRMPGCSRPRVRLFPSIRRAQDHTGGGLGPAVEEPGTLRQSAPQAQALFPGASGHVIRKLKTSPSGSFFFSVQNADGSSNRIAWPF